MALEFEWDDRKAASNKRKHGVTFEDAKTIFSDPNSLTIPDPAHSTAEDRFVTIGRAATMRLLVVVHSERGDKLRLISARRASRKEREDYATGI
jgi:uncharacterized protein